MRTGQCTQRPTGRSGSEAPAALSAASYSFPRYRSLPRRRLGMAAGRTRSIGIPRPPYYWPAIRIQDQTQIARIVVTVALSPSSAPAASLRQGRLTTRRRPEKSNGKPPEKTLALWSYTRFDNSSSRLRGFASPRRRTKPPVAAGDPPNHRSNEAAPQGLRCVRRHRCAGRGDTASEMDGAAARSPPSRGVLNASASLPPRPTACNPLP